MGTFKNVSAKMKTKTKRENMVKKQKIYKQKPYQQNSR